MQRIRGYAANRKRAQARRTAVRGRNRRTLRADRTASRGRRRIREGVPRLTATDRRKIAEAKRSARPGIWRRHLDPGAAAKLERQGYKVLKSPIDQWNLKATCKQMEVNLPALVEEMQGHYPGREINVLIEGCGFSTTGEELAMECKRRGLRVKIIKTDIYSPKEYARLAEEFSQNPNMKKRGVAISSENYHQLTPEELHRLGKGKIHIVVSRTGGLTYTQVPQVKGMRNIWYILAPKGQAHLMTEVRGKKLRLRDESRELTAEGRFLERTRNLSYEELDEYGDRFPASGDDRIHQLVIKKGIPISWRERDRRRFERLDIDYPQRASPEEIENYRTIFDEMEKPPIDMPQDTFEKVKRLARQMETNMGIIGRRRTPHDKHPISGTNLQLRYEFGRYYLYLLDEYDVGHMVWREPKLHSSVKPRK